MHDILVYILFVLAGISLYAGYSHLAGGSREPVGRANTIFAWICLLIAGAAISRAFVIHGTSIDEYVQRLKCNVAISILVFMLLPWFVSFYTQRFSAAYLAVTNTLFGIFFTLNLWLPYGVSYTRIAALGEYRLPWGETVSHGIGPHGWLATLTIAVATLVICRSIYDLFQAYQARRSEADLHMLVAFVLFAVFVAFGIAVRMSVLKSFSPGTVGFAFVILAMSRTLAREREEAVRVSEQRFRTLFEQAPIGIALCRSRRFIEANPVFLKMHGYADASRLVGVESTLVPAPEGVAGDADGAMASLAETPFETTSRRTDGSTFPVYVSAKSIEIGGESLRLLFLVDQTKDKESQEKIRYLARYDTLTGLPNKTLLIEHLEDLTNTRVRRWNALLIIDLNEFRILNDSLGHDTGDLLLKYAARRLVNSTRDGDTVARIGGDEFGVLLCNLGASVPEAASLAESRASDLGEALRRPFQLGTHEYHNSASIGVAMFDGDGIVVDELFKQAELAMYQAKHSQLGGIRFFDKRMAEAINNRVGLESELRRAIDQRELYFEYQKQVDESGRTVAAEALVRWRNREGARIAPAQFIPLAEETGLIVPLGRQLLERACAQARAWQDAAETRHLVLAVNISAKQLRQTDFVDQVRAAVERHGVAPTGLKLELTESMLFDQVDETIRKMSALKGLGMQFALDDFGTGYSSIQYLKNMPLDELKIDQSFVRDICFNDSDKAIVETVIAMARALNLSVIAEGVETEEQRLMLSSLGCTRFQGFLFGRPSHAEALLSGDGAMPYPAPSPEV